jgi:hypothetical protein
MDSRSIARCRRSIPTPSKQPAHPIRFPCVTLGWNMRRREFLGVLAGATWPVVAHTQQPALPVVGFIGGGSADTFVREAAAFRKGLNETGNVEGQNVTVEYHWLEGHYERLSALMADLVRRQVAVIATPASAPAGSRPKLQPRRSRLSSASPPRPRPVWSCRQRDRCGVCHRCARAPRRSLRRCRRILQQPARPVCHVGGARQDSNGLF